MAPDDLASFDALLEKRRPRAAVACTVVDGGLRGVESHLRRHGIPLWIAGRDLPCPLRSRYRVDQLGTDRWVGAIAAHREFGAAVVVDAGSAVTVDGVGADGLFVGGAIAPGLGALATGLSVHAPRLPPPDPGATVVGVPDHTQAAVDAGVLVTFCGGIERLVGWLREVAMLPDATLVVTGGDADVFSRHARFDCRSVPDLVHRGLRILAEDHGLG